METIVFQETDQDILEILYGVLEIEGFRVYALSEGGPDFLGVIARARPHVVMLDYRLSGEECVRLCRDIKTRYPHIMIQPISKLH